MQTPQPINLLALAGLGENLNLNHVKIRIREMEAERWPNGFPDEETQAAARSSLVAEIFHAIAVVEYHNGIIGLITAFNAAERKAHSAKFLANAAYDDLTARTTTAWHAAHHRYILAIHATESALAEFAQAFNQLATYHAKKFAGTAGSFYEQLVPADKRVDVAALNTLAERRDAGHEIDLFREQHRTNLHLLSFTITGAYPDGYEPAPTPTAATEDARSNW